MAGEYNGTWYAAGGKGTVVEKIAKSEALGLFNPGATVSVTRVWKRADGNELQEVDIPTFMVDERTVEKVRSRDLIFDTGSHVDVMNAEEAWYYEKRLDSGEVCSGPFVKIVWANGAVEYDLRWEW